MLHAYCANGTNLDANDQNQHAPLASEIAGVGPNLIPPGQRVPTPEYFTLGMTNEASPRSLTFYHVQSCIYYCNSRLAKLSGCFLLLRAEAAIGWLSRAAYSRHHHRDRIERLSCTETWNISPGEAKLGVFVCGRSTTSDSRIAICKRQENLFSATLMHPVQ
ncbi:hypothetical protein K491DRAFT_424470 [Lophiostoma macrostomum CBS 122681]|uniref:Uncharacterized protein n=1 Tax=Lophiostoma macrostomum CBS 122681 TaxID=1314788 RepID=A0A6A6T652_9PLEO|nr:hypothetical protein K491DRAFT_424470 [Lophiostoma macrostomum CBS 122681]